MFLIRHQHEHHIGFTPPEENHDPAPAANQPQDYKYNYHKCKMMFGLVLMEFNDAVKEGDGERLFDLYKLSLLLYKAGGHTKYSYVVLLHLLKITALFSPFEAHCLKWNRFYNSSGGKGKNIPLDLKKEQQNKVLKTLWRSLGANLNETNASRVANALESMECILESIDKDCNRIKRKGRRSMKTPEESVAQILADLVDHKVFHFTQGRDGYRAFPNFPDNLFKGCDYRELHGWMKEHIELWGSIYENET